MAGTLSSNYQLESLDRRLRQLGKDLETAKAMKMNVLLVEQKVSDWRGGYTHQRPIQTLWLAALRPETMVLVPRLREDGVLSDHLRIEAPNAVYCVGNGGDWMPREAPIMIDPYTVRALATDLTLFDPAREDKMRPLGFLVHVSPERVMDYLKARLEPHEPGIMPSYLKTGTRLRRR